MGIFDRLSTLFRSNINDLISRAENPEKMLNQLIVDMRDQVVDRSEEHTSELQSRLHLVCRLLLEKKNKQHIIQNSLMGPQVVFTSIGLPPARAVFAVVRRPVATDRAHTRAGDDNPHQSVPARACT